MDSELPDKEYFRIGEVARIVGVKPYVLRYWEGEFKRDIRPERSASNQRVYRRRDVETFLEIKRLRYEEQLQLTGAKRRLRNPDGSGRPTQVEIPEPTIAMTAPVMAPATPVAIAPVTAVELAIDDDAVPVALSDASSATVRLETGEPRESFESPGSSDGSWWIAEGQSALLSDAATSSLPSTLVNMPNLAETTARSAELVEIVRAGVAELIRIIDEDEKHA